MGSIQTKLSLWIGIVQVGLSLLKPKTSTSLIDWKGQKIEHFLN